MRVRTAKVIQFVGLMKLTRINIVVNSWVGLCLSIFYRGDKYVYTSWKTVHMVIVLFVGLLSSHDRTTS